jgi:hypothetical protein
MNTRTTVESGNTNHVEDSKSPIRQSVKDSCSTIEKCVHDYPQYSMLVSLGVGLGTGILIGALLGGSRRTQSHWFERQAAERLGRRIMTHMGNLLPDAITDRLSG